MRRLSMMRCAKTIPFGRRQSQGKGTLSVSDCIPPRAARKVYIASLLVLCSRAMGAYFPRLATNGFVAHSSLPRGGEFPS